MSSYQVTALLPVVRVTTIVSGLKACRNVKITPDSIIRVDAEPVISAEGIAMFEGDTIKMWIAEECYEYHRALVIDY